jgi:hypothetical protein
MDGASLPRGHVTSNRRLECIEIHLANGYFSSAVHQPEQVVMKPTLTGRTRSSLDHAKRIGALLLAVCMLMLMACGGTKVYTADKTIVYRDNIYNMSSVQRIGTRKEIKLPDGEVINSSNMDKKQVQAIFKENPKTDLMVSMIFEFDDKEMVYLRAKADSYSEYSRMESRLDSARKDITKFVGDKKKTQLKLR